MPHSFLIQRFEGERGKRLLADALSAQWLVGHDRRLAEALADAAELRELVVGEVLIAQGDPDNDIYFVLAGSLSIVVNGREVAIRTSGHHVGEMALIDPSLRRTATNTAREQTLVACITEPAFVQIADSTPRLWRALASELARRLKEREKFHRQPNRHPKVFVGSSTEARSIASAVTELIPTTIASATLWSKGVFGASRFPIDDLEALLPNSDFAVLVVAPDDRITFRGEEFDAPRDNVVFELGLFMGALARTRTFILAPNGMKLKIPTDLLGLTQLRYSPDQADPKVAVAAAIEELLTQVQKQGPR